MKNPKLANHAKSVVVRLQLKCLPRSHVECNSLPAMQEFKAEAVATDTPPESRTFCQQIESLLFAKRNNFERIDSNSPQRMLPFGNSGLLQQHPKLLPNKDLTTCWVLPHEFVLFRTALCNSRCSPRSKEATSTLQDESAHDES